MSTQETRRGTAGASNAAASCAATVPVRETDLQRDLWATAHLSEPAHLHDKQPQPATAADQLSDPPTAAEIAVACRVASPAGTFVVAGVDGSGCARHAARWAATEADRRSCALRLVYAYLLPASGFSMHNPHPANELPTIRQEGRAELDDSAAQLRREHPTLDITTQLIYGDAATVLRGAAVDSVLTVVGCDGTNRLMVALGSVAADLAATCSVPVAVIRPLDAAASGPVVVGVDASSSSESVVAFAFEAASARRAALTAVRCWTDPAIDGPVPSFRAMIADPNPIEVAERAWLSRRMAGWARQYPDVNATQVLVHDRPTPTLIEFARTAQLVVVGNRVHGGITGMLLGSTSQGLITHSLSPIVVVREHGVRRR